MMRKLIMALVVAAFATPALATELTADMTLGTSLEAVQSKLTEMGYEVRKGEMEDGKIEVYFVKDNQKGEVYVDPQTGKIAKLNIK